MAYYTRTGDKGKTRIVGGHVYDKYHIRVDSYGTIDELNSYVGFLISIMDCELENDLRAECIEIQQDLFDCGSDLAQINQERPYKVKLERVEWLEAQIDRHDEELAAIDKFIIPNGSSTASYAHICRTVARRAERLITALFAQSESSMDNEVVLQFVNRVSDYFFVLARVLNHREQIEEVMYRNSVPVFRSGIRKLKKIQQSKGEDQPNITTGGDV